MRKTVITLFIVCIAMQIKAQTTITLHPGINGKDAHTDNLNPNANNGTYPLINAGYNTVGGTPTISHDFLQFNLSTIPVGAVIQSAKLSLYHAAGANHSNSSDNYELFAKALGAWNEDSINWNNQPALSTTDTIQIGNTLSQTDDKLNIDIAPFIQAWVNNPAQNFGMAMHLVDEPGALGRFQTYGSSDNADSAVWPKLVITYTACAGHTVLQPGSEGKDAHIDNLDPNANNGTYPFINAGYNTVGGTPTISHDFLQFDLSAIPTNASVSSAKLSLYHAAGGNHSSSTDNYELLAKALSPWIEDSINWNNQPALSSTDTIQIGNTLSQTDDKLNIDITSFVQYWVNNPAQNFGMAMHLIDEPGALGRFQTYGSSDNADSTVRPKLIIDWVACNTDIHDLSTETEFYELYPNPTTDILGIRSPANQPVDVTVFDISGRKVFNAVQVNTISTAQLQAGVYLLCIQTKETTVTKKFVRN